MKIKKISFFCRFYYIFKDFLFTFFSIFIPNKCIVCQQELNDSEFYICPSCLTNLNYYENDREKTFSLFKFTKVSQRLIWLLKYDSRPEVGIYLGKFFCELLLKNSLLSTNIKYNLIPIPLHPKRLKKRGYNQAEKICQGFIAINNKMFSILNSVERIKNTVSQTTLSKSSRRKNVSNIFKITTPIAESIKDEFFIIIDDVITTGSTIKELTKVLKNNGIKNIFSLTIISAKKIKNRS